MREASGAFMNAPNLPPIILTSSVQPPTSFWLAHANYGVAIIAATAVIIAAILSFISAWTTTRVARINANQATSVAATSAELAVRVSHGAKISEFREKWLGALRNDVTDCLGAAERWNRKWQEINDLSGTARIQVDQLEQTQLFPLANQARMILRRLSMRLNPWENDFLSADNALLQSLGDLLNPGLNEPGVDPDTAWNRR